MNSWTVDNQNILDQQWFWYCVGNDPTGQHSLDTLPKTYTILSASEVKASFTGATFVVSLDFNLFGSTPGSGNADMAEVFTIRNTASSNLTFHFFEYSNFVLGGPPGDLVNFLSSNLVQQVGYNGASLSETNYATVTGLPGFAAPMHHEANYAFNTLNSLNQGSPYTLNDSTNAGPGDVTWAFQWDAFTLGPGVSANISKNIDVQIPEPSTVVLVGLGLLGAWAVRRRRN